MKTTRKATAIEAGILIVSAITAARLAKQLADHNVGISPIICLIALTLFAGVSLATSIGLGIRTTTYTCPAKGCPVNVRAQNADPDELTRFQAYATDHTRHEVTR